MTAINPPLELVSLGQLTTTPMLQLEELADQFRESSFAALRAVQWEISGDAVTLRGRVPSFYLKQMAQTLAGRVRGVRYVLNEIEVSE